MTDSPEWITWQLADSAFPSGGFAHSAGMEAAVQAGLINGTKSLEQAVEGVLQQIATGSLPLVRAVAGDPRCFDAAERRAEATLINHVARRASRAQGQALLTAAPRVFGRRGGIEAWAQGCREQNAAGHLAPVFGHVAQALGLSAERACALFVFLGLRSTVSAAVRLGVVGPLRGQALLHEMTERAEAAVSESQQWNLDDLHQTQPLLDLLQAGQDRLYSRLFQS